MVPVRAGVGMTQAPEESLGNDGGRAVACGPGCGMGVRNQLLPLLTPLTLVPAGIWPWKSKR